jgi:hypothetical protein
MNSREIVRKTLDFENPERVAHSFMPSDVIGFGPKIPNPEGEWRKINEREWRRKDEWGNIWGRVDDTSKGEVVQGAIEDLNEVETVFIPDFDNPECYTDAKAVFESAPDFWCIGFIHGFTFSAARKLRRMDQYLMDLLLEREKIEILQDRIDEQIKAQMKQMRAVGADCIMIAEDWGTQLGMLINPKLWCEMFKPRFADLCAYAHSQGLRVFVHSCGKITDIIPDLIETGVDLFQFDQPRIHGIDTLQEMQDQGQITFWCPVDIQKTLQTKDEALIREEADELLEKLWRGRGGFIAGFYTDEPSIGLEPKWQEIACDQFLQKGKRELFAS